MVTDLEYALMAGRAYQSTRSQTNWFSIPKNWGEFHHVPNPDIPNFIALDGFEAVYFKQGSEVVISYAGTGSFVDQATNGGLATGLGSTQLLQAAAYYMKVKADNPPGTTITFTGHSLGGGLASLMAVFFNEKAVTFDQAPFRNAANFAVATQLSVALELMFPASTYPLASTWLDPLNKFILSFDPLGLGWSQDGLAAREAKVSAKRGQRHLPFELTS